MSLEAVRETPFCVVCNEAHDFYGPDCPLSDLPPHGRGNEDSDMGATCYLHGEGESCQYCHYGPTVGLHDFHTCRSDASFGRTMSSNTRFPFLEAPYSWALDPNSSKEARKSSAAHPLLGGPSTSFVYAHDSAYHSRINSERSPSPGLQFIAAASPNNVTKPQDVSTDFLLYGGEPSTSTSSADTHDSGYISSHPGTFTSLLVTPDSDDDRFPKGRNKRRKTARSMKPRLECELCPKTYARAYDLRQHLSKVHHQAKAGGKNNDATSKHSKHDQSSKEMEIIAPPSLPRFLTVLPNLRGDTLDVLSRQTPMVFRQKLHCLSKSSMHSVDANGKRIRDHISDIIAALQELHSQGLTGARNTFVDCIFFYDNDKHQREVSELHSSLVSLIQDIRTMELLLVPIVLSFRSTSQLEDSDLGAEVIDVNDTYQCRADSCVTTSIRFKGRRYAIGRFNPSNVNVSLPTNMETIARIKIPFEDAKRFDTDAKILGKELQIQKTTTTSKRKRDEDEQVKYDDSTSEHETDDEGKRSGFEEEEEGDEEEEEEEDHDDDDDDDDGDHDDNSGDEEEEGSEEEGIGQFSFLPFFFGDDSNGPSPTDSTDSGSSGGSGTNSTPASSASENTGGGSTQHGSQPHAQSQGHKVGSTDIYNDPQVASGQDEKTKKADKQPLPLICWYPAAGTPCTAKHAKRDPLTRYLFHDHVWGKKKDCPNHRLPRDCQQCHRLFENQNALDVHVEASRQVACVQHSPEELEGLNRGPQTLGITEEKKDVIDQIRSKIKPTKGPTTVDQIRKQMAKCKNPPTYDDQTMELLQRRVESNIQLYINGSNLTQSSARAELWKWYIIFKQLRPDDGVPLNPFTSKSTVTVSVSEHRSQTNILRVYNSNINQLCADQSLPQFTEAQRNILNQAFLNTLEMQGAQQRQAQGHSTNSKSGKAPKKLKSSPTGQMITPQQTPAPGVPEETGTQDQQATHNVTTHQPAPVPPPEVRPAQESQDEEYMPPGNRGNDTQEQEPQSSSDEDVIPGNSDNETRANLGLSSSDDGDMFALNWMPGDPIGDWTLPKEFDENHVE